MFATTALVLAHPPMSFGKTGTLPISSGVLWTNFAVMLIGEVISAVKLWLCRSYWLIGAMDSNHFECVQDARYPNR